MATLGQLQVFVRKTGRHGAADQGVSVGRSGVVPIIKPVDSGAEPAAARDHNLGFLAGGEVTPQAERTV